MLNNIGFPTLILILILALLLFGPNKLPELGRAFGKTLREFRRGTRDIIDEADDAPSAERKDSRLEGRGADQDAADAGSSTRRLPE
jgi:sec-independent protein translocase protein TatA